MQKHISNTSIEPKQALSKLMAYCSRMERSSSDVSQKLKQWNIEQTDAAKIIESLYKENFLSDERYARSYIRGKFLYNKWGIKKIHFNLKMKGITDSIIYTVIDEVITDDNYFEMIAEEIGKKSKSLKISDKYMRKTKLLHFAMSRGYDTEIALKAIAELDSRK